MRPTSKNCPDRQGHKIFNFMYGDGCLKCDYWKWNERYFEEQRRDLEKTNRWIARGCKD